MSNNLDDIQGIISLPDHIAEVNDILGAYLDGKPTVEMTEELAKALNYCVYLFEDGGLKSLVEELQEKEPDLFNYED